MKFLHCADLHLGCPGGAERLRAFLGLLAFCKQEKVEVLLIAGDLFESPRADERTRQRVFSALGEDPALCAMRACMRRTKAPRSVSSRARAFASVSGRVSSSTRTLAARSERSRERAAPSTAKPGAPVSVSSRRWPGRGPICLS